VSDYGIKSTNTELYSKKGAVKTGNIDQSQYLDMYEYDLTTDPEAPTLTLKSELASFTIPTIGKIGTRLEVPQIGVSADTDLLQLAADKLIVNGVLYLKGKTTEACYLEVGHGRSGNGYANIDLIGDATYSDYGLRIIRNNAGANTESHIIHKGTGYFKLILVEAGAISFSTTNAERVVIAADGTVFIDKKTGIGTNSPNAKLTVDKGIGIGAGAGISSTHGERMSLQFLSDTSYGGTYNAHSGYLIYSTMPSGWGSACLHFAVSTDWATYNTGTPTMTLSGSNVAIGTTDPGGYKLRVNGTAYFDGCLMAKLFAWNTATTEATVYTALVAHVGDGRAILATGHMSGSHLNHVLSVSRSGTNIFITAVSSGGDGTTSKTIRSGNATTIGVTISIALS
jgi:hypothetical protein